MSQRTPLPVDFVGAPFSTSDARAGGVTASRLRARDLAQPYRGVRSLRAAETLLDRAAALQAVLPDGAHFSHSTAAGLSGAPLPLEIELGPLHVSVRRPGRASRRSGVVWHETDADYPVTTTPSGIRVAPPAIAFCQSASRLRLGSLVAVGDFLVTGDEPISRRRPLCDIDELHEAVAAWGSRRGVRTLRRAVQLVRCGPLSRPESLLRVGLVQSGFPEPSINLRLWHPFSGRTIMVDLAYPELKLAFEYEGDYHRTDRSKFQDDIRRRERLAEIGWTVIRVTSHDLGPGWPEFLARVRTHVLRAQTLRG